MVNLSLDAGEPAADQREQIGGLWEGIVPHREVPVVPGTSPCSIEIAVGEQDRRLALVGLDARRVDRHHVRPVEEIGDAAKAFRLALRAIDAVRAVEAHQLRVG